MTKIITLRNRQENNRCYCISYCDNCKQDKHENCTSIECHLWSKELNEK